MAELPTGTVTFLFTDIEGSTKRWEQHREAMQAALARHDTILREAIEGHSGVVFKTVGDAFYAAFATAPDALQAALAAQQALQAEPWSEVLGSVRVRMALHTGVAEQRDRDYFGPPLNRVARLLSAGHGGQILLSVATHGLIRDQLAPEMELRDLGEHRLKDLQQPEGIFQVVAPGLPTDFPPLKTLDTLPNNLPPQPTPFVGREREVEGLRARLLDPDVRLVTLTGPGGTGKTRLSLQVAAELLDDFADGVFFVSLAPISDPDLVASTIAQTLGVKEVGDQPLRETLKSYLRDKQLLLLLDNFEQVLAAAPLVADLLMAASRLKALVTSRAALHLRGEREVVVPPLDVPNPEHLRLGAADIAFALSQYEAVKLFIARAQDAKADFMVTNANAPAVAEICVQLDGLPLAIELAAARIKLLTPQAMLQRLEHRLKLLTGGARDLPARQQTLRNTIDWSYDLLDPGEQRLFARLGVFVGGCTLQSAEAVCNADGDLQVDVLDGLQSLLDKSLLRPQAGVDDEPRFGMLETIREYALERLGASGEAEALRQVHATNYLALVEAARHKVFGSDQTWVDRLEQEHGNLRAALAWSWAEATPHPETGARLGRALYWFWYLRGHLSEGRAWIERALAQIDASQRTWNRATALHSGASIALFQGDLTTARAWADESVSIWRELADREGLAHALFIQGVAAINQGDERTALPVLEESAVLFRDLGSQSFYAAALMHMGDVALEQGDYPAARTRYEESLRIQRDLGNRWAIAQLLNNLGEVARCEGDYNRAAPLYDESLQMFRERDTMGDVARSLHNLGYVAHAQGHDDRAVALFTESLQLFQERGNKRGMVECLMGLAAVAGAHEQQPEDARRAARLLGTAEAQFEAIGAAMWPADRREYERSVAAVRAALSEEAFAAAWAEGRAMTLEQAIAYALEEIPDA